jgi:hypothetical protein
MEPANAPELYAVTQFRVPRIAADALDLQRITHEMRDAGMVAPNIEMNVRHAGAGRVRVTCRALVALRLIAEWRHIGERAPHTDDGARLREAAALARLSATVGCCKAWNPRRLSAGEVGFLG